MAIQTLAYSTSPFTQERTYSLLCDTAADLPSGTYDDTTIGQGWTAKIVENGASYVSNSSGTWVLQPTSSMTINLPDVYSESEVDALLAPMQDDIDATNAVLPGLIDEGAKNLLHVDGFSGGNFNGLTYTINGDGSITISGTKTNPSAISYTNLRWKGSPLYIDEFCDGNHILTGCPSGGGSSTYRIYAAKGTYARYDNGSGAVLTSTSETGIQVVIAVVAGYNPTSPITFKPMICEKDKYDVSAEFENFGLTNPELTSVVVEDIDGGHKNTLILTDTSTQTSATVTCTYNGDGTYTINGTATAAGYFYLARTSSNPVFKSGSVITGCTGGGSDTYKLAIAGTTIYQYGDPLILTSDVSGSLIFSFASGSAFNNMILKPMVCTKAKYDISPAFVPYCPTLQELYQMYLSGNRSVPVQQLRSENTEESSEIEPETDEIIDDIGGDRR